MKVKTAQQEMAATMDMRRIVVRIRGIVPGLLMERLDPGTVTSSGKMENVKTDDEGRPLPPDVIAEKKAYRLENGNLCIPKQNMMECLRKGGTEYSLGTELMKNVQIPCDIDLGTPDYKVATHVARQKGKSRAPYLCYRPHLVTWEGDLVLDYDQAFISRDQILRCLATAGLKAGIMGWRPSSPSGKGGPYGRFKVVDVSEGEAVSNGI